MEQKEIKAIRQSNTKNKRKWLGSILGIQVSVYMDKLLDPVPEELVIKLQEAKGVEYE